MDIDRCDNFSDSYDSWSSTFSESKIKALIVCYQFLLRHSQIFATHSDEKVISKEIYDIEMDPLGAKYGNDYRMIKILYAKAILDDAEKKQKKNKWIEKK